MGFASTLQGIAVLPALLLTLTSSILMLVACTGAPTLTLSVVSINIDQESEAFLGPWGWCGTLRGGGLTIKSQCGSSAAIGYNPAPGLKWLFPNASMPMDVQNYYSNDFVVNFNRGLVMKAVGLAFVGLCFFWCLLAFFSTK